MSTAQVRGEAQPEAAEHFKSCLDGPSRVAGRGASASFVAEWDARLTYGYARTAALQRRSGLLASGLFLIGSAEVRRC
jgi:hypothetical protein